MPRGPGRNPGRGGSGGGPRAGPPAAPGGSAPTPTGWSSPRRRLGPQLDGLAQSDQPPSSRPSAEPVGSGALPPLPMGARSGIDASSGQWKRGSGVAGRGREGSPGARPTAHARSLPALPAAHALPRRAGRALRSARGGGGAEEPSALVPGRVRCRSGRAPAPPPPAPRLADVGCWPEGSDVAAVCAAAARPGPFPASARTLAGLAMADRGGPLEAAPLPAEVRESLAELELELSEGEPDPALNPHDPPSPGTPAQPLAPGPRPSPPGPPRGLSPLGPLALNGTPVPVPRDPNPRPGDTVPHPGTASLTRDPSTAPHSETPALHPRDPRPSPPGPQRSSSRPGPRPCPPGPPAPHPRSPVRPLTPGTPPFTLGVPRCPSGPPTLSAGTPARPLKPGTTVPPVIQGPHLSQAPHTWDPYSSPQDPKTALHPRPPTGPPHRDPC